MKRTTHLLMTGLLVGIAIWGITVIFYTSHPGRILELKGIDYLFYLRGSVKSPENIIIVAIDEASFSELKIRWPWPRKMHAKLIDNLKSSGAKIIGFDILFADPSTNEDDNELARSIEMAGNVILSSDIDIVEEHGYRQIKSIEPMQILKNISSGAGVCTLIYDPDNVIRRSRLNFGKIKSFVYEILKLYGLDQSLLIKIQDKDILINFVGPPRSIKTISYYQALNYKDYLPEGIFKDKIVLVGRSLASSPQPEAKQPDMFYTPRFPGQNTQMAGVEIIANFIDTILRDRFIRGYSKRIMFLFIFLLLIPLSIIEVRIGYIKSLVLTIFFTIVYCLISYIFFTYRNIFLPLFMPITGLWLVFSSGSLTKYLFSEQEKRYIKEAFQKYVPPSVVKKVLEAPEKLRLGGDEIIGTVLFSDLERFTTVSEKFNPEMLVSFINEYLTYMSDIIFKYDGTITRFIGDAILAIWGAPVWRDDHAIKAVFSAMEMKGKLSKLNNEWRKRKMPELKMRIGINTGQMIVGNVGSKHHFDYTAMGDSVNLASRLESINRFYGTSIVLGHLTYEEIYKDIRCRKLDIIRVKGKEEEMEIYEPICETNKLLLLKGMEKFLYLYEIGYKNERERQWDSAIKNFNDALEFFKDDIPTNIHLKRCLDYRNNPPSSDWGGVQVFTEK